MNLAIIDVQPCYRQGANAVRDALVPLLNEGAYERVVFIRVNEELSGDTEWDALEYWADAGVSAEVLESAVHLEKTYAFFRGWMDNGVDDEVIVTAAKLLRQNNAWDTRELDEEELDAIEEGLAQRADPLHRPDELEQEAWRFERKQWTLCGGGRHECLKEFELWLDSLDITHERLEHLVYG